MVSLNAERGDATRHAAHLQEMLAGAWMTQAIYVAAELQLPDLIAQRTATAAELASLANCHETSLTQLLNALTTIGILTADANGVFDLSPIGKLLVSESPSSMRSWALWWGRSLWPAWGKLLHSVKTGESARAVLTGTEGFAHLETDAHAAAVFYGVTVELSRSSAPAIVAAFDFSAFNSVVDVGGGYGELLVWILHANPRATGTLFELPQARAGAEAHLEKAGVANRCDVVTGNFFESIPAGANAYVLKSVLHDWNDARATQILRNCRTAMNDDTRLLIIEQVMPQSVADATSGLAVSDLTMLVAHGAGERTLTAFINLLDSAGLKMMRVIPVAGALHIIEAARQSTGSGRS